MNKYDALVSVLNNEAQLWLSACDYADLKRMYDEKLQITERGLNNKQIRALNIARNAVYLISMQAVTLRTMIEINCLLKLYVSIKLGTEEPE